MPPKRSRRTLVVACAILLATAAAAYHFARGGSVVLAFTEAELQQRVAALPPYTRTYLGVVRVTVEDPRVSLVDGAGRVRAGSDVEVEAGIGARTAALGGSVEASAGIRYDPETGAFHLTDVEVERIDLPGLPEAHAPRVRDAVSRALRAYYDRHPVYTLRPTDTRRAAARLLLKDVTVRGDRLLLTLGR